jgi:hypothetical protein
MKKFVLAAFCTVSLVSFVLADEFTAIITKVEGNKITYFKTKDGDAAAGKGGKGKGGKGGGGFGGVPQVKTGDAITGTASASITVVKGKFDMDTKAFVAGDPVEGGLKADMFKDIDTEKGVTVTMTIEEKGADKGNISKLMTKGFGGKGKGGKGAGKGGN